MIYGATLKLAEPGPDGETELHFASLDGEHFIPVSRPAVSPADEPTIAALLEGDGNFKPMTFGPRALEPSWWASGQIVSAERWEVGA